MSVTPILLFSGQTANAPSEVITLPISQHGPLQGVRDYHYVMIGTWDTATLVLEISIDGGSTWFIIATNTADAEAIVQLGPCKVRFTLSSVGASTDLDASFNG